MKITPRLIKAGEAVNVATAHFLFGNKLTSGYVLQKPDGSVECRCSPDCRTRGQEPRYYSAINTDRWLYATEPEASNEYGEVSP